MINNKKMKVHPKPGCCHDFIPTPIMKDYKNSVVISY